MPVGEAVTVGHDIGAHYANMPAGIQLRTLTCSCGYGASGLTWKAVGHGMDLHLAEVKRQARA